MVTGKRMLQKDKAQQSERMLAEMAAQMQQLRVEKEELQGRNNLLESLLKVQQQQQHDSQGARRLDATQACLLYFCMTLDSCPCIICLAWEHCMACLDDSSSSSSSMTGT